MKTRTLTVLQVDIVGSTTTASHVSRQEMADYIDEMSALITHAIRYYGGDPFKFTGDGYLAWFESASDCLNAAQKIQRDIQLRNLTVGGRAAGAVRVVIHTADLIMTENDLLGDGLAIVSRLEKMTPANAIYVTETTFGICKRAEFEFEYVDTFEVRGFSNPVRVYELKYQNRLLIEENLCILVSDIKRFSRLMVSIQPAILEEYLSALHRLHRYAAKAFSGVLSKIMGDKVLMTFHSADDATAAALALQEGATTHCQQRLDLPPIQLTIGIASGDVYRFAGDMYGVPVNDAFMMASRLDNNLIAMTDAVFDHLTVGRELFAPLEGACDEWEDCALTVYIQPRTTPLID